MCSIRRRVKNKSILFLFQFLSGIIETLFNNSHPAFQCAWFSTQYFRFPVTETVEQQAKYCMLPSIVDYKIEPVMDNFTRTTVTNEHMDFHFVTRRLLIIEPRTCWISSSAVDVTGRSALFSSFTLVRPI